MKRSIATIYLSAGVLAMATASAAQTPTTQTPTSPRTTTSQPSANRTNTDQSLMVTVEGCLLHESNVPGRKPNIAERAGVGDDYILTNARVLSGPHGASGTASQGTSSATGAGGAHSGSGATGATGTGHPEGTTGAGSYSGTGSRTNSGTASGTSASGSTGSSSGSGSAATTGANTAASPSVQASGNATGGMMYEVDDIAETELKRYVNQRVQIDGTLDHGNVGSTVAEDLPEIKATAIRAATGSASGATTTTSGAGTGGCR